MHDQNTHYETVALLGAGGAMGAAMARNLLAAGIGVRAWNRTREKAQPLAGHGAVVTDTPAEAAEGASVLVTMLSDGDAVLEAVSRREGALGAPRPPLLWAQMSTIGEEGTARCMQLAQEHGVTFVDAPVLGTKGPAEEGKLLVMASGPDEEWVRARLGPVFDAVARRALWLGPAGNGTKLKLVANAWLLALVEGCAESVALAEGLGLDPALLLEAVADGPLDTPYLRTKAKAISTRDFDPSFKLALAAKDARLVAQAARSAQLELPVLETVREQLERGAREHGEKDMIATYLALSPTGAGRRRN